MKFHWHITLDCGCEFDGDNQRKGFDQACAMLEDDIAEADCPKHGKVRVKRLSGHSC